MGLPRHSGGLFAVKGEGVMPEQKNLVFIITSLAYGGAETQLVQLARRLRSRRWNVRIVSMIPPQAFVEEFEQAGIPVYSLDMRRGVPDPRALFRLAAILRRERPQVVHSHMVHANLLARMVRPIARVPVLVCTAHNINEGGRLREIAYRLSDPLCDLTTQVSRAGLERSVRVGAVPGHRIRFFPNGVDAENFRPDPEARRRIRDELEVGDAFAWLAVGRFEKNKDYPNMLRAFARLRREREGLLLIAGGGSLRGEAERLAAELGVAASVKFLGIRKDVPGLMNAADAYLMSSAWEGMPIVLLEASATGLPVVATDVGGNGEVVLGGRSGFLVPPGDPEALARAMLRLLEMPPDERGRMGGAGRARVMGEYDMEKVVDKWENLYGELLDRKAR